MDDYTDRVAALIREDRLDEAVALLRFETDASEDEALQAVQALAAAQSAPVLGPVPAAKSEASMVAVIIAVAVAIALMIVGVAVAMMFATAG